MKINKRINGIPATVALMAAVVFCVSAMASAAGDADKGPSTRMKKVDWSLGTGWFKPYEGDFEGAPFIKLGMEYRLGDEAVLTEVLFSQDDDTAGLPTDNYKHTLVQLAYKRYVPGKFKRFSLGMGLQHHHIDFGGNVTRGKLTVVGLVDYNISSLWKVRLQSSVPMKNTSGCTTGCGLKFGGYMLGADYNF